MSAQKLASNCRCSVAQHSHGETDFSSMGFAEVKSDSLAISTKEMKVFRPLGYPFPPCRRRRKRRRKRRKRMRRRSKKRRKKRRRRRKEKGIVIEREKERARERRKQIGQNMGENKTFTRFGKSGVCNQTL